MQAIAHDTDAPDAAVGYRLTAADRCDNCGAQAYVLVEMESGELLFCAHHARKHREKLAPLAVRWHDETDRLGDGA